MFTELHMGKVSKIHASKQPRRPHFIPQWAKRRGLTQADLAREIGADKSIVSRWYAGASPGREHQERLAAFFDCDREDLYRHPDDTWLKRFFQQRQALFELLRHRDDQELERIEKMIELTFPKKTGTDG